MARHAELMAFACSKELSIDFPNGNFRPEVDVALRCLGWRLTAVCCPDHGTRLEADGFDTGFELLYHSL